MADKNYTTEAKIEAYLGGISISTGAADDYILATQELIEQETDRNFKADTSATSRLYDGNDRQYLIIDDCVEVTKVEVGSNQWGDSFTEITNPVGGTPGYYLLPANYSAENEPIRKIGLRSQYWIFGHANHRITAKWGYSAAVPDDIEFAATVIAAGMYYFNRGLKTGAVKSEKTLNYSVSYANEAGFDSYKNAMMILDSYKKYSL